MDGFFYNPWRGINLLRAPVRLGDEEAVALENLYPSLQGKLEMRRGALGEWASPYWETWFRDSVDADNDHPAKVTNIADFIITNQLVTSNLSSTFGGAYEFFLVTTGYYPDSNKDIHVWMLMNNPDLLGQLHNDWRMTPGREMVLPAGECPDPRLLPRPRLLKFGQLVVVSMGIRSQEHQAIYSTYFCSVYSLEQSQEEGVQAFMGPFVTFVADTSGAANTWNILVPQVMGVYRNRVVYAGFPSPYSNYIVISDVGQFNQVEAGGSPNLMDFKTTGRTITVPCAAGDRITAVVEVMSSDLSNALTSRLLILTERSAFILEGVIWQTGESVPSTPPYTVTELQYACGCASQETVVRTSSGVVWASDDDVWAMDWGMLPRRVGTKIRAALQAGRREHRQHWHAVYDPVAGAYKLALPAPGQVEGTGVPLRHQYWLDLRGGTPANASEAFWYGPQKYKVATVSEYNPTQGTVAMNVAHPTNLPAKVLSPYMAKVDPQFGTDKSIVTAWLDAQKCYDSAICYRTRYGLPQQWWHMERDNTVLFRILSKQFDGNDIFLDKVCEGVEVSVWADDVLPIQSRIIVDGGRLEDVTQDVVPWHGPMQGIVDKAGLYTEEPEWHQYQSFTLHPDPQKKFVGRVFQVEVSSLQGWGLPAAVGQFASLKVSRRRAGPGFPWQSPKDVDLRPALNERKQGTIFNLTDLMDYIANRVSVATGLVGWTWAAGIAYFSPNPDGDPWKVSTSRPWEDDLLANRASEYFARILGLDYSEIDAQACYFGYTNGSYELESITPMRQEHAVHTEILSLAIRLTVPMRRPQGVRYEALIPKGG